GFRWEEVRNRFYERGLRVPPLHHLSLNFRSVGSIVRLANALLDLKQQLIGLTGAELKEQWKFNGRPPFLLTEIDESKILNSLSVRGAGRIILVRDKEQQRRLKSTLQTELVFTIHEAKGLEFDTVLLWKFSYDRKSASIWRKIRTSGLFDRAQFPHIRHEINLLYVAVTRARNTLLIFDPSSDVWDVPGLRDHLFRTGERDTLSDIWQRVSTPEEWERQGEYFFDREHFSAAAECFKNGGNTARSEVAHAFDLQRQGRYEDAGVLFEKNGYMEKAAQCYETGGLIEKALPVWQSLGAEERVFLCRIALYEQKGDFEKAGDGWLEQGRTDKAVENWKKAGAKAKLGNWFKGMKKFAEAAESFESAKEYSEAAFCYKKAGKLQKAADLYSRQGNWGEAIPLFKKLRDPVRLLECYLKSKDHYNAALLCEKGRAVPEAVRCLEAFAQESEENKAALLSEATAFQTGKTKLKTLKASVRFSAIGMYERSAPLLQAAGYTEIALSQFTALGDYEKAADCHIILKDYYAAATAIERTELPDKWDRVTDLLAQFIGPFHEDSKAAHMLRREADTFLTRGANDGALARYKAIWARDEIRKVYLLLDRDEEGIEWFLRRGMYEDVLIYLKEKKEIELSQDFVLRTTKELTSRLPWEQRNREIRDEVVSRLITGGLGKGPRKELLDAADAFLSAFDSREGRAPDHILDLIMSSRNCNALFRLAKRVSRKKKPPAKKLKTFFKQLEQLAEREGNAGLSACCRFLEDGEGFLDLLEGLKADSLNYELFADSERHYPKAVDYLAGINRTEDAVAVYRRYRDFGRAARVFEDAGMSLRAAREYRDAGLFEDAIRCYRLSGDERGIAGVHERKGDLGSALAIWRKLGNKREERRLLRKMKTKEEQLDLF
ncbi:MAG: 3'-5' exonuclease, partial [Desulfobacterales bacterium]|nr:3'-5' exonuclease [Desulfobacterales bacterium]